MHLASFKCYQTYGCFALAFITRPHHESSYLSCYRKMSRANRMLMEAVMQKISAFTCKKIIAVDIMITIKRLVNLFRSRWLCFLNNLMIEEFGAITGILGFQSVPCCRSSH